MVIQQTIRQLYYFKNKLKKTKIVTVYIGGGTPSCIDRNILKMMLKSLYSLYSPQEYTIEVNPETLDEEFLYLCNKYGVSRLSLGIQCLNNTFLNLLKRKCSNENIKKSIFLLKKYWQGDLNIDLLTGIPGQNKKNLENDICYILENFSPTHISLYSLTIEKGTQLYMRVRNKSVILPSFNDQDKLWMDGYRLLEKMGFKNYEISNFAKPGKECKHNICYWHLNPYLGIGPGAVSTLPDREGGVLRLHNQENIDYFLSGKKNMWQINKKNISINDFLFENIMMGFRLKKGIHKKEFERRFGITIPDLFPYIWDSWKTKKWVKNNDKYYVLSQKARFLLNALLIELKEVLDSKSSLDLSLDWISSINYSSKYLK